MTTRKIRQGGRRILLTFTASYLLLLLIPIGMGVGTFSFTQRAQRQQMTQASLQALESAIATLEGHFEEIDRYALMLHSIQSVTDFMTVATPLDANDLYKVRRAIKELPNSILISPLITWFMLYNPLCDVIALPQTAYIHLEKYYGVTLLAQGLDFAQWRGQVLKCGTNSTVFPSRTYTFSNVSERVLAYRKNMAFSNNLSACAVFYLSEAKLVQLFSPAFQDTCLFQIYDRGRQKLVDYSSGSLAGEALDASALAGSGSLTVAGSQELLYVIHDQSSRLGWTFLYAIPNGTFSRQSARMTLPILLGTGAMILVGVGLVLLLLAYNRRPLKSIVGTLPLPDDASSSGLWRLATAIKQLSSSHGELLQKTRIQQLCLQSALINQLIDDNQEGDASLREILDNIDITLTGESFRGVYMRLDSGLDEEERTGLMTLLQAYDAQLVFLTFKGTRHLALLYCQKTPEDTCAQLLTTLYHYLHSQMNAQVFFFVGYPVDSLRTVSQSFAGARQMLNSNPDVRDSFLMVDERGVCEWATAYSWQDEQKLINLAAAGRIAEIQEYLGAMRRQLLESKIIRHTAARALLFHRMLYTLALIEKEEAAVPVPERPLEECTVDQFFSLLEARYAALCQNALARQQRDHQQRYSLVLADIARDYTDPDLCLSQIALRYGMTENYLSAYIKKNAGINFSTYLERLRIQRADQLLADRPEQTIEQIASQVGYANVKSFRRAYLRVKGLTPSAYRAEQAARGAR